MWTNAMKHRLRSMRTCLLADMAQTCHLRYKEGLLRERKGRVVTTWKYQDLIPRHQPRTRHQQEKRRSRRALLKIHIQEILRGILRRRLRPKRRNTAVVISSLSSFVSSISLRTQPTPRLHHSTHVKQSPRVCQHPSLASYSPHTHSQCASSLQSSLTCFTLKGRRRCW